MVGVGGEVFIAAAEFEEFEHGVAVSIGGGAGGEGAEGLGERFFAEAVGGVDARVGRAHGDAQEAGRMQAQSTAGFFGTEGGAGGVVEQQGGFELGAGAGVVDEADAVAEVEALAGDGLAAGVEGFGRGEETAEAAAEVGGAGEVGLGGGVGSAEREDAGRGGDGAQQGVGGLGKELNAVRELEGLGDRAHRENCSCNGKNKSKRRFPSGMTKVKSVREGTAGEGRGECAVVHGELAVDREVADAGGENAG